jgi:zinc D-Ala-D-Ala carboxypeptidase
MKKYRYFNEDEFTCKCGCNTNNISSKLIERLDNARHIAGVPFAINSGCRCQKHNKRVGGSPTSSHLNGTAVDIKVSSSKDKYKILTALMLEGFDRIGIAKTFIHVDIDDKPKQLIWSY